MVRAFYRRLLDGRTESGRYEGAEKRKTIKILCVSASLWLAFLTFVLLNFCIGCSSANGEVRVREATHADGMWYPDTASELGKTVDGYLSAAEKQPTSGRIMALVVPHAGYRYCGHVAANAYKQIQGMKFDTVVLVGPSHRYGFAGASVYESGVYRNPLGDVEVDSAIAERLIKENDAIKFSPKVHIPEHSLENQIPFLQRTLSNFRILPILMSDSEMGNCDMLSAALVNVLKGKNVLLIASTDMSHYPLYDEAVKADKITISALETMEPDIVKERLDDYLKRDVSELHCMLCGRGAVLTVMKTAKKLGADSVKILKYANSGDVPMGDKNRVVGYMAAMMYDSKGSERETSGESLDAPLDKINRKCC